MSFFHFNKQLTSGGLNMVVLENTTDITVSTNNEVRFFKGVFWGLIFVVPFWSIIIAVFIWLCK
ncbi:hypothetical protein BACI_pCIXO100260 (plasmid) [Bacillus cereus biovar anthracis str. CI]|nr:hypothetical protein BACI_pCIXO100260 [Bacillus cereus biovar anthracis str. CI]